MVAMAAMLARKIGRERAAVPVVGSGETGTGVVSLEIGDNPLNPFKFRAFLSNITGNALSIGFTAPAVRKCPWDCLR